MRKLQTLSDYQCSVLCECQEFQRQSLHLCPNFFTGEIMKSDEDFEFERIERENKLKSSGMDCCTYDCNQGRNCPVRNKTLEEVAKEFEKMKPFGDTAQSFAQFVRGLMK
jgi:hypothetical protein